ncbi:PAS domain-containing protein [Solemya velesiana gill symbiont]|nr:PAS domain S-box protein [Solemya velesiana gill symbiont]
MQMRRMVRIRTAELAESERRYRTVFNGAPEGIWLIDQDIKTLQINERLSEILGYSEEEMQGKTPMDFVDEENREVFLEQIANIATTERRNYEIALRHKQGHNIPTQFNSVTLRHDDGSVMAALAFVEDITGRYLMEEKLRQSEKYLRTLIEAEPACVKTLDNRGHLISMNAAGLGMIEADSIDQVRNASISDLVDEDYREDFDALTRRVFQGDSGTLIFRATGLKGRKVWLETHAAPVQDSEGNITRLLGVTHDVTKRVEME